MINASKRKSNRLLETIKCLDGKVYHLDYHQARLNGSRQTLGFDDRLEIKLSPPQKGLYRCRVIYGQDIEQVEYLPYLPKKIQRLQCISSDITYALKYLDRDELNALMPSSTYTDDIIIIKDGLVTDTTIANLCFYDGKEWLTPKTPLLEGTTRARYLDEKKIKPADIYAKDIQKYSKIALLNAMLDFYIIENAIIV